MALRRLILTDLLAVLGAGILCVPLFLLLMPNIEASRTESRIAQAYADVLELVASPEVQRRASHGNGPADTTDMVEPVNIDPWGTPYRFTFDDDKLRVSSAGPDTSFNSSATDNDDIHSDRSVSPVERIHARKRRQFFLALAATAATWSVVSSIYLWSRTRRSTLDGRRL